jgi:hypothetical protein
MAGPNAKGLTPTYPAYKSGMPKPAIAQLSPPQKPKLLDQESAARQTNWEPDGHNCNMPTIRSAFCNRHRYLKSLTRF